MSLKARIKTLSEVPEALQSFYTEQNGEFVLSVEGMVGKDKLDEFRDNNVNLKRQLEERDAKFKDVDIDKYRELVERDQKERDKKLIDAGQFEQLLSERTAAMKADFDKQIKAAGDEKAKLSGQLEGLLIDSAIRDAAAKTGVRSTAVDDVLLRGRAMFRLVDGKATAMNGDAPQFGKDGSPLGIAEWVSGLTESAPHLFEPSSGTGAPKAGSQAVSVGAGKVARNDSAGFLANLDAIASGKTKVV
ncbi:hypothetical protein JFK97_05900 [Chromobacterium phragmitis]|uniref:hypothetical protein n=1 Tax=Chromobacterium amazonense TaxID=1382803 RepID=UPI0021B824C5|nr:hypothetical protein [Chromobacterium amazonense]MBM2883918.1 hypothetical protein [Chromobacterium amazonense]MDE1711835.1 hypothetical protein [Chromobacterium amazonense]